jgi:hypothetical protein
MAMFWAAVAFRIDPSQYPEAHFAISRILGPVCMNLSTYVLVGIATCACVQGSHVPACIRRCCDGISALLMFNALIGSTMNVGVAFAILAVRPANYRPTIDFATIFTDVLVGTVLSWVYAFPMSAVLYSRGRRSETKKPPLAQEQGGDVAAQL